MLTSDEINRYSAQLKLDQIGLNGQRHLKNARVLCVGAGGLGSPLLLYLAAAGVGTIGIIDADSVELSNLQRQILYQHRQVGQQKTLVAKKQLKKLNPYIKIITYNQRINQQNAKAIITEYDILADCTDNFPSKYLLHDHCFYLNKPYVFASVSQYAGQCSVFLGQQGPCLRCLFPKQPSLMQDCSQTGVLGVLPGLFGIIQATEVIKLILKLGNLLVSRLLMIDILAMKFREYQITQNPDCECCVKNNFHRIKEMPHHTISAQELQQRLTDQQDIFLLDVRSPEEHQHYNFGGTLIPLSELPHRLAELNPNQTIVVYCHSGVRSLHAVQLLLRAQFKSVMNLEGGVVAWRALS